MSDVSDDIHAVSLWEGPDDRAIRIASFRVTDGSDGPRVRISAKTWTSHDLPSDVEGWSVVVTDDGEHINSSVVDHDKRPGFHKLQLADPGPVMQPSIP